MVVGFARGCDSIVGGVGGRTGLGHGVTNAASRSVSRRNLVALAGHWQLVE